MLRNDIIIDWNVSPRIVTVLAPSVSVTMQDLYDTLRVLEADISNIDNPAIVSGSGKENLGGGVYVGLTVTLSDAQLAFESRPGPTFVQCNATGGNLVATDSNGNIISPIYTTEYTQVILTSSSSATLQELSAIQYSSYNNGVWIDSSIGVSGTDYPVGTPFAPVNNLTDAISIALLKGFKNFYFLRNFTFTSSTFINSYNFIGLSPNSTTFTFDYGAITLFCSIKNATVTGNTFGIIDYENCLIHDMSGANIALSNRSITVNSCLVEGLISLPIGYSGILKILDSWSSGSGIDRPILDMGNSTASVEFRNFSGGIDIKNINDPSVNITIGLNSGFVKLENNIIAGNIVIRGVGTIMNDSSGTATVDTTGLISTTAVIESIQNTVGPSIEFSSYNNIVVLDVSLGVPGTNFPIGTHMTPVNNLTDAKTIAAQKGFSTIHMQSDLFIPSGENIDELTFSSTNWLSITLDSSVSCVNTNFERLSVYGEMGGFWNVLIDCWTYDVSNFCGWLRGGSFTNIALAPYTVESAGQSFFDDVLPMYPDTPSILTMNTDTAISFTNSADLYEIRNMTAGSILTMGIARGGIIIDNSCTGGIIIVTGLATVENNSPGGITLIDNTVTEEGIWNTDITTNTDPSTAAYSLWNIPKKVVNKIIPFLFAK